MQDSTGPVYEVTLLIDGDIAEAFDAWLEDHVQRMLELPGFVSATRYTFVADWKEQAGQVVCYQLESEEALGNYLAGPAHDMRNEAVERFGDRFSATRRVLHAEPGVTGNQAAAAADPVYVRCLNCGQPLAGQYCSACGQRARSRLISIWELVRDAVGDLFELDSRLWRTLLPLLFRPGRLTRSYLMGQRACYMPPFRTYLVLSVVFFLVAFFDPQKDFGIFFSPGEQVVASDDAAGRAQTRDEVLAELESDGISVAETGADFTDCNFEPSRMEVLPEWLAQRLTSERLEAACKKVTANSGRDFFRQLLDNVPAALFVLLPLMAFVLKILYPLSRRYYVEHLLLVLHYHAFVFLILTLEVLYSRLARVLHAPDLITGIPAFAVAVYVPLYLYKSMRHVYDQGRAATLLKFVFLILAYLSGFALMLLFVALYTAFSF